MSKRFSLQNMLAVAGLVLIIGSMLLSTILPGLGVGTSNQPAPQATAAQPTLAAITFPTPDPDGPQVEAAGTYVHPSAVFFVMQPQGWTPSPTTQSTVASVSMVNGALYSVVHAYVQQYDSSQSLVTLDGAASPQELAASWAEYETWQETSRVIVDDRLIIDFELSLAGNTYLARHITWVEPPDTTWALVLRLVVPGNNPALLDALQDTIIPSYHLLPDSLGVPLIWPAYIDGVWGYSIKYPETWALVDGGPGRTVTLSDGSDVATLTLSAEENTAVADADAAREWVAAYRDGADISGVEAVTRAFGDGFRVAYTFTDADGEENSGLAVLINAPDGRLLTANLRLLGTQLDLLDEEASAAQLEALQVLGTFAPLPEMIARGVPEE